jgi:hypothetical protein
MDKDVRARSLRDISPEEFYPVYGDASLKGFDAFVDRLFVRVDKQRSYLLYGDFQTGHAGHGGPVRGSGRDADAQPEHLPPHRHRSWLARGQRRVRSNVFAIQDSLRQVIEEFASQGSGPYALRNNAVLEGSETVEVIVRDRNQPSRIVSVGRWRGWWTTASSRSPGASCSTSSCPRSTAT